jgi:hypothetical protein
MKSAAKSDIFFMFCYGFLVLMMLKKNQGGCLMSPLAACAAKEYCMGLSRNS